MISMENLDDEDPDYAIPGPSNAIENFNEETARKNKEKIIIQIINKEFTKEIETKEKEIIKIQNRLDDALKTLHFLRTVIVNDYYNKKQCQPSIPQITRQTRLHPAVKKLIGKSPKSTFQIPDISVPSTSKLSSSIASNGSSINTKISSNDSSLESLKSQGIKSTEKRNLSDTNQPNNTNDFDPPPKKIPRYIPPKNNVPDPLPPSRGERYKMVKRIIVGNFATLLPDDSRHDSATHKWQVYVNGPKEEPDISKFVSKVKFFLDPSYKPNDVVTVTNRPFNLTRRGWGEFPIRITLYFHDPANKSRDIVYNLKLFKNNPSRQGPVAETWYDIYIFRPNLTDTLRELNNHEKLITNYDKNINNTSLPTVVNKVKNNKIDRKIQTVSHVQYEHDYVNFISLGYKLEYKGEKHVTITHSPPKINQVIEKNNKLINLSNKNLANSKISVKQIHCLNNIDENANKNFDVFNDKSHLLKPLHINIPTNLEAIENEKNLLNGTVKQLVNGKKLNNINEQENDNNNLILPNNQSKNLLKNSKNKKVNNLMINIKIDPSKSLMLNSNSNIPTLKIVNQSEILQPMINNKVNGNHVNGDSGDSGKVINGKNNVKTLNRAQYFNGILESLENIEIKETEALIRFIAKRIPLVTELALDPDYRKIHPYAVEDEEEFLSYNTGKQRAIELYRAKMIRSILRKKIPEEQVWTLKELMIWCRYHGFTPVWPSIDGYHPTQKSSKLSGKSIKQANKELTYNTCTEPVELHEWIKTSKYSQNNNSSDDEFIDIESLDIKDIKIENTDSTNNTNNNNKRLLELEMPREITSLHSYVCQTVRKIGVKFGSEEIIAGVSHPAASHLLAKIAEKLMEDLLRSSLASAFERNPNKSCPESLTLDDVRSAILSRDEFDIFTNSGLGTQQIDD